ncbi:MAG: metallophosphoesterase family protein [Verrucomicrobiales bacterium]|nr:metallophosphoesterase family protein [Verrucomicrobiales bacterium]
MTRHSSALPIAPGLQVDPRRAVWLPEFAVLVIADLHLGYVWVERSRGALLPLVSDDAPRRLLELIADYQPRQCVFLGDTLHATAEFDVLGSELSELINAIGSRCQLHFVLGNHDRNLAQLVARLGFYIPCTRTLRCGPHLLVHGDEFRPADLEGDLDPAGFIIYGHEHPAINVGDGVTTQLKVPCFLAGHRRLVLPAFSRWSAGQVIGRQALLSHLTPPGDFRSAIAILGDHLLPIPLRWES